MAVSLCCAVAPFEEEEERSKRRLEQRSERKEATRKGYDDARIKINALEIEANRDLWWQRTRKEVGQWDLRMIGRLGQDR